MLIIINPMYTITCKSPEIGLVTILDWPRAILIILESLFFGLSVLSIGLPSFIIVINFLILYIKKPTDVISRILNIMLGKILIIYFLPKTEKWTYFFGFDFISIIKEFKLSIDELRLL